MKYYTPLNDILTPLVATDDNRQSVAVFVLGQAVAEGEVADTFPDTVRYWENGEPYQFLQSPYDYSGSGMDFWTDGQVSGYMETNTDVFVEFDGIPGQTSWQVTEDRPLFLNAKQWPEIRGTMRASTSGSAALVIRTNT